MKGNINPNYSLEARKIIGTYFSELRESKQITQFELAEKMGVSITTVQKVESGIWNYPMDILFLFCFHLDLYLFLPEKSSSEEMVKMMQERHRRPGDLN